MRILMFYHSLLSCWNHGNAHFLRGVVSELLGRGHQVEVFEPRAAWNEPNNRCKWDFVRFDPKWHKFAEMLGLAAEVARTASKRTCSAG
jgi:spore maturation protein CgeB